MNYLVTGACGFIGSALVKKLVSENHFVRCFDDFSRGSANRLQSILNDIDIIQGDIRDADAVSKATKGMDCVIHLAYINGTRFFYEKPELILEVALKGITNVIDACIRHNVSQLFYASSSEVYQSPKCIPTNESAELIIPDVLNPRYSYGGGKAISELMVINYGRNYFDKAVIFRPHNVYGENMGWEHVIPELIKKICTLKYSDSISPKQLTMQGDGSETRAFIYIDDFTEALNILLNKAQHMNVYHIGNPDERSIKSITSKILKALDCDYAIVPGALQQGSTLRRCPDISKISALGFTPQCHINDYLPQVAKWYENALQATRLSA